MSTVSRKALLKAKREINKSENAYFQRHLLRTANTAHVPRKPAVKKRVFSYKAGSLVKIRKGFWCADKSFNQGQIAMALSESYKGEYGNDVIDILLEGEMLHSVSVGNLIPHQA